MPTRTAATESKKNPRPDELFRQQMRRDQRLRLERELSGRLQAGTYPFEGGWYTLEEIQANRREMRRFDRLVLAELIALFLVMLGLGLFPVWLLSRFVLP